MARYTPINITSGLNSATAINQNFASIAEAIDDTLSRVSVSPNAMSTVLDMNNFRIINNPEPTEGDHLVTKAYADGHYGVTGIEALIAEAEAAADAAALSAAASAASAVDADAARVLAEAAAAAAEASAIDADASAAEAALYGNVGFSGALDFDLGLVIDPLNFGFDMGLVTDSVPASSVGAVINGGIAIKDGVSAPSAVTGQAIIFVDSGNGDLKVIFDDGTTKTISTDD